MVLLILGRGDLLLLGYLNSSAVLSDNDTVLWRNSESLRVRYPEENRVNTRYGTEHLNPPSKASSAFF